MIEFCTNEELIKELISRKTFAGFVVTAYDFRTVNDNIADYRIYGAGLTEEQAKNVLLSIASQMDQLEDEFPIDENGD